MKLVKMAWVLGGMTAFGLGLGAEACSSSSTPATGGTSCVTLATCCATLGAAETQCTQPLASADDATCASFLTMVQAAGKCAGITTSGSGTSGFFGTGTGTFGTGTGTFGTGTGTFGTGTGTFGTGTGTFGSGTGGGNSGSGSGTGAMGTGSGSGSCEKAPKLFPETVAGVYCPYSGAAGAKSISCPAMQHCCEPPMAANMVSTCEPTATACPVAMSTDWQCLAPIDCAGSAGGPVCCGTGTIATQAACGSTPAFTYVSGFTGSTCAASCASTYVICETNADCGGSGTCIPGKAKGGDFGHCM